MTQRLIHVSQGKSCSPSVPSDKTLCFSRQDPEFGCSKSSPQNHLGAFTSADSDLWTPPRPAELICGIGDQESKFLMSTLGVSHAHSSLRTTDLEKWV